MSNNGKKLLGLMAVLFLICFGMGLTSAAFAQEFSAEMVSQMGKDKTQAKIYVSHDKTRMEMKEGVMIIRNDKKVSWMLMPSEKMYLENSIDYSKAPKTTKDLGDEVQRESLGVETVDGNQAEKFKVTYTENGKKVTAYQWLVNSQIPIRIEAEDKSWSMQYKNLKIAAQSAELFEVPAGYQKMTMPDMGSLGDMFSTD